MQPMGKGLAIGVGDKTCLPIIAPLNDVNGKSDRAFAQ
jgi:hypothetical protein